MMRQQEHLRLLSRMRLAPALVLETLLARTDGEEPIGARLRVLVAGLQSLVMEGVALGPRIERRPDHGLMRVGEAPATKIRHRIRLAPDDVVQDPEAEILQDRTYAEDVVIGADHPQCGVRLHHPSHGGEPGPREGVILGEGREAIPVVVDRVDHALVGARQASRKLQIVGRISEDEIDAAFGSLSSSATQSPTLTWSTSCVGPRSSAADTPIPVRHTLFRDVGSERLVRTAHMPSNRYATNTGTMPDRGKGEVEAARHDLSRFEKGAGRPCHGPRVSDQALGNTA